jgi:hypothetical protein
MLKKKKKLRLRKEEENMDAEQANHDATESNFGIYFDSELSYSKPLPVSDCLILAWVQ